jgi:hypothetical protein
MIRIVSVLALALVSASAYATPKLGDYAAFDLTASQNGQTAQGSLEQEIVQANGDQFLERQTVTFSGQAPEITDNWKPVSEFLDDNTINSIVANCASAGGTAQSITVPAGTYNTCAMNFDSEDSKGTVWITMVPFGVARVDTTIKENGVQVTALLRSFR